MATRSRATVQVNPTNVVLRVQSGPDGDTPANAPSTDSEFANLQAVADEIDAKIATLKSDLLHFIGLKERLVAAQSNPTALAGVVVSTIFDEDPGQVGFRIVVGS